MSGDHTLLPPVSLRGIDITQLIHLKQSKRLPQALLLSGSPGMGKQPIARHIAAILLCEQSTNVPCGMCAGCRWQHANTHPDYSEICPQDKATTIKIDQVRALIHFLQQTPQQAGYRVVVLTPADALTLQAANSLLKTIEEPGANTVLILTTAYPMTLPATLRSRCVRMVFHTPPLEQSCVWLQNTLQQSEIMATVEQCHNWLTLSDGAPLTALALATQPEYQQQMNEWLSALRDVFHGKCSPVTVAQTWSVCVVDDLLQQWFIACRAIISYLHGSVLPLSLDWSCVFTQCAAIPTLTQQLFTFIDQLLVARRRLHGNTSVNVQLLLDSLLVQWRELNQQKELI